MSPREGRRRLSARGELCAPGEGGLSRETVRVLGPARFDRNGRLQRATRIVATLGPACADPLTLRRMLEAGVDIARINFSHIGTEAQANALVDALREAMALAGRPIEILGDLQGPKIRVSELERPIEVAAGEHLRLTAGGAAGDGRLPIAPAKVLDLLQPGARVLIEDGKLELRVTGAAPDGVEAEVVRGGAIGSKKGVNVPDTHVAGWLPTPKDERDIEIMKHLGIGLAAVSFVQDADDVERVRSAFGQPVRLIAKIETPTAMQNLKAIAGVADGIMVARGDLAVELGDAEVPIAQRNIHMLGNRLDVPTGTATQMLGTMTSGAPPTRAEVSDVARAVLEGSKFVMTSEETSVGRDPVGVIRKMAEIVETTERAIRTGTVRPY